MGGPGAHRASGAGCSRGAHVFPPPGWQLQLFLEQVRGQRPQALRTPPPPPAGERRPSGFQQSCWLVMLWGAEQSAGKADSLVSVLVTVRESPPCRGRKSS